LIKIYCEASTPPKKKYTDEKKRLYIKYSLTNRFFRYDKNNKNHH